MASGTTITYDYNVITASTVAALITAVKAQLATTGWSPLGQIVVLDSVAPTYAQTMIFVQNPSP